MTGKKKIDLYFDLAKKIEGQTGMKLGADPVKMVKSKIVSMVDKWKTANKELLETTDNGDLAGMPLKDKVERICPSYYRMRDLWSTSLATNPGESMETATIPDTLSDDDNVFPYNSHDGEGAPVADLDQDLDDALSVVSLVLDSESGRGISPSSNRSGKSNRKDGADNILTRLDEIRGNGGSLLEQGDTHRMMALQEFELRAWCQEGERRIEIENIARSKAEFEAREKTKGAEFENERLKVEAREKTKQAREKMKEAREKRRLEEIKMARMKLELKLKVKRKHKKASSRRSKSSPTVSTMSGSEDSSATSSASSIGGQSSGINGSDDSDKDP